MLTLEGLRSMGACAEAIETFRARWPEGRAPMRAVLLALAAHPEGVEWLNWLGFHSAISCDSDRGSREGALCQVWTTYALARNKARKAFEEAVRQAILDAAMLLPEGVEN